MDVAETEDIKNRWQEYTELYKEDLQNPHNHDGVFTHLESDILECEIKWPLGSMTMNKVSGGYGIPRELLQILKYEAVKMLHSTCQQIRKTQQGLQDWKRSVFIPIPKKRQCQRMLKLPHIFKLYTCVNYYLNDTRNLIIEMDFEKIKLVTEVTIVL